MLIKQAESNDISEIQRICTEGQYDTYGKYQSKDYLDKIVEEFYNENRLREEIDNSNEYGTWYVAVDDEGNVIGTLIGGKKDEEDSEIYALYVDSCKKRQGAGKALVQYFLSEAKQIGSKGIWVSVDSKNHPAIGFYEAVGFDYKFTREKFFNEKESNSETNRMYQEI